MGREARGQPSPSGPRTSVSQVSASDQKHIRLDREWALVDHEGKAGNEDPRFPDRRIQRAQTDAMAARASEEVPQASRHGHQEATPAASAQQEALLFNRILRRFVPRQGIFEATSRAEASAQSAKISRAVE